VPGASQLNKQQLIEVLVRQIPERLRPLLFQIDETRYGILRKIADRGGHGSIRLEEHQLDYFKERGLLFSGTYKGKPTLVMPHDVLKLFKEVDGPDYRENIRRNTVWVKLAHGLLFYYGTLGINDLFALLQTYTGDEAYESSYLQVLFESEPYYQEISVDGSLISTIGVMDPDQVIQEHQMRPALSYYPFTKEQLLQAGVPGYVDRHSAYQAFVDFIRSQYTISKEEADLMVEECVYEVQLGSPLGQRLAVLQDRLEMDNLDIVNQFMHHIVQVSNHTRQWFLKGYSSNELSQLRSGPTAAARPSGAGEVFDFATRKKIGRNDPCPCGSGQKFKKCCGS
jgi:hypothetical protein